jgi:thermostable 8-oxoguanine DNA glycosylase
MIDPTKITNFNATRQELEEMILFWVCAAGKNGITAARCLDNLLESVSSSDCLSPFEKIMLLNQQSDLGQEMKKHGIGCFRRKAVTFVSLCESKLDLRTCTVDDLESISGIGPKTARCFLIHSRPNQYLAGLDTHILKFLRDRGHKTPVSTPNGKKYKELEEIFLRYVRASNKSVAEFDLYIWNQYRSKNFVKN